MNQFPTYVQILAQGYSETYKSSVLRSEFDRGLMKQRSLSCNGIKTVTFNAIVCDENYVEFREFWRNTIKSGADWFEFLDPSYVPAVKKKARLVAADQTFTPQGEEFPYWGFSLTMEMYD